jgi:hypothetical protein
MPDATTIEKVKTMKLNLADKIGWFNSKNSLAHITICEFTLDESTWEQMEKKVRSTIATFTPFKVQLNAFDHYPNGAFYITTDIESKKVLKEIMKTVTTSLPLKSQHKSSDPHLSIARRLNPEQLKKATHMFTSIHETFMCDAIYLRRFNPEKKQFDVVKSYPFLSQFPSTGVQTSLF